MLCDGFLESCERFAERPALALAERTLSYAQLYEHAAQIAATLHQQAADTSKLTAVLGHRSVTAFAGILGSLLRGHGYVPLNPTFPVDRSRSMLVRSRAQSVVVESAAVGVLSEMLEGLEQPLTVLVPEVSDISALRAHFPQHSVLGAHDLCRANQLSPATTRSPANDAQSTDEAATLAYLLFTSGSTGQPKGVMVSQANVRHFVRAMVQRYGITEHDRLSQTFDLTFDLSAFDMFVAWERGACLCVPSAAQKLFPGKYISAQQLTIWFSVPSTAVMMKRLRMLKPGQYPSIRYSLFCGEALPLEIAEAFAQAAPKSVVENLYGPTELTIACTLYRYLGKASLPECELGLVPIGEPYPGMDVLIADEALREVPSGQSGELLMTGPQLSLGYFEDETRTRAAFVTPPGRDQVYYRTGDRVRRTAGGPLVYLGRVDNQIKIQGYRVELGEVEAAIRTETNADVAVAIGFPQNSSGADGIVGFVNAAGLNLDEVRERLRQRLPAYMHPQELRHLDSFPLNANGKIDRKALLALLESEARESIAPVSGSA